MAWRLEILPDAQRDLLRLDPQVRRRILKKLVWFRDNFDTLVPEPLTGGLAGFFRLRVGDYRVIYDIERTRPTLVVHQVGHRRKIYGR